MPLPATSFYLIDRLAPKHEVSILAGASGAGKSTFLMQALAALQQNQPIFGQIEAQPDIRVAWLATDRSSHGLEMKARAAGVDWGRVHVEGIIGQGYGPRIATNPRSVMQEMLARCLPCDLIIIDPLINLSGEDPRMYHKMFGFLVTLADWAYTNQVTIIGTHHANKARTDYSFVRPQDRINGSGGILGFTSTQMILLEPEKGEACYQFHAIPHEHAPIQLTLTRRPEHSDVGPGLFDLFTGEVAELRDADILRAFPPPNQSIPVSFLKEVFPEIEAQTLKSAITRLITQGEIVVSGNKRLRRSEH